MTKSREWNKFMTLQLLNFINFLIIRKSQLYIPILNANEAHPIQTEASLSASVHRHQAMQHRDANHSAHPKDPLWRWAAKSQRNHVSRLPQRRDHVLECRKVLKICSPLTGLFPFWSVSSPARRTPAQHRIKLLRL